MTFVNFSLVYFHIWLMYRLFVDLFYNKYFNFHCIIFYIKFTFQIHDETPPKSAYRNSWTQDARVGRWTLDVGLWTLDAGLCTLDSGRWTLDAELWTLDAGHQTLDSGCWTLDAGPWTVGSRCWTLDGGRWTSHFGR